MILEPIVEPDLTPKGLELADAYVLRIPPKETSRVLKTLHVLFPLDEVGLGHLKRVCTRPSSPPATEVLIAPISHFDSISDAKEALTEGLGFEFDAKGAAVELVVAPVPRWPARSVEEREAWKIHWPVDYMEPNRTQQISTVIGDDQLPHIEYWVKDCVSRARAWDVCEGPNSCVLIVDPYPPGTPQTPQGINGLVPYATGRGRLVGFGGDRTRSMRRPLAHAVMEAVEAVASAERNRRRAAASSNATSAAAAGEVMDDTESTISEPSRALLPYLCTTYDIYAYREPCIMCAMGLVHSRVGRVFIVRTFDELDGVERRSAGFTGPLKVHALSGTNHKYKVYRCLDVEEADEQADALQISVIERATGS